MSTSCCLSPNLTTYVGSINVGLGNHGAELDFGSTYSTYMWTRGEAGFDGALLISVVGAILYNAGDGWFMCNVPAGVLPNAPPYAPGQVYQSWTRFIVRIYEVATLANGLVVETLLSTTNTGVVNTGDYAPASFGLPLPTAPTPVTVAIPRFTTTGRRLLRVAIETHSYSDAAGTVEFLEPAVLPGALGAIMGPVTTCMLCLQAKPTAAVGP